MLQPPVPPPSIGSLSRTPRAPHGPLSHPGLPGLAQPPIIRSNRSSLWLGRVSSPQSTILPDQDERPADTFASLPHTANGQCLCHSPFSGPLPLIRRSLQWFGSLLPFERPCPVAFTQWLIVPHHSNDRTALPPAVILRMCLETALPSTTTTLQ